MSYVPPYRRNKFKQQKHYTKIQPDIVYDEQNFPSLGSCESVSNTKNSNTKTSKWGKGSFKDVVSSDDVVFDFSSLEKLQKETFVEYYNRLSMFFKRTTKLNSYHVFSVTHSKKQKCYRAIARHEIVAKFLCQRAEYENHSRLKDTHYIKFKNKTFKEMMDDEDLWEYVMNLVDGDDTRRDEAINIYYKQQKKDDEIKPNNWLTSTDVKCIKTTEQVLSKEKIIY